MNTPTHTTTTTGSLGGDAACSWALVEAAQAGDREAFAQLYRDYAPHITRYLARRMGGDRGLVEDLTSETFLRAWRRIDTVSDQGRDAGAWLVTIARNLAADHYRSARVQRERATDELPEMAAGEDGPEQRVIAGTDRHSAATLVERAMAGLAPAQRRAVQLYDLAPDGKRSIQRAADEMRRSVSAVRTLRSRAMSAMAARLGADGLSSSARCLEAVDDARDAVEHAIAMGDRQATQARERIKQARHAASDRWAARSIAAAIGAEVAL